MAGISDRDTGVPAKVDDYGNALRTSLVARGDSYHVSAVTGILPAALAVNSPVFAMRLNPGATKRAFISSFKINFTTIAAFTVPVTAARRLALFRGSGAALAGGAALATGAVAKHLISPASQFTTAQGGDIRVSTTAALTAAGVTFETDPLCLVPLTHVGAAGAFVEQNWDFQPSFNEPLVLDPGQLIVLRNPVAFDAGGTWQAGISVSWIESDLL